ncbi:UNVERIFIED_CONTAM: hypothetical protein Scaly_2221000 [Sesamum calycinum]|uniref:Integrase catalytic domain-containing protein n=1 Tax=Sesamum calycinum TaxID=2727403 RepID=A0AAW2M8Y1_9LAMI
MTNDIQKQYDRLDDVPSIMLRMKEVYAVLDRHIIYASTKSFFGTKMAEESSVQSHGVKMLSLMEKLKDLKIGLDNNTYINTHKYAPTVLVGEASTSKANGKRVGCWKTKKEKRKVVTITARAESAPTAPKGKDKGKEMVGAMEVTSAITCRLSHISKDRIKKLVDSKSLEIDNLENLPTCESYLKEKMTKKPFVGQSALANSVLDFIHTNVYGPLNTPTRGGYSYFITFTDVHSRYGYVYLMRYKIEAFGRFNEYRFEVENQTGYKIKALQLDRGGEYLSGEFIDYLKENEILSQWTPPGMPQLNGVAERRNQTLLNIV